MHLADPLDPGVPLEDLGGARPSLKLRLGGRRFGDDEGPRLTARSCSRWIASVRFDAISTEVVTAA
jgi:hypothetical protein